MNGIIVIDKPQGMTSHDVVSFLRRKTGVKRIGHTGTLDPMATGVLPVFIGQATRLIEYAGKPGDPEAKLYRCTMRLGLETDTQDIWGKVTLQREDIREFSLADAEAAAEVEAVLKGFEGSGTQKPPMYSAVKVEGRKLYEYARKGAVLDESLIRDREIYIKRIDVKRVDVENREICFDVLCSKGVYIRTLCSDAGRALSTGAVMSGLVRLKSDGFSIDTAIPLEALKDGDMPPLLPMDSPLGWMERVEIGGGAAGGFAHGRPIMAAEINSDKRVQGSLVRVYCGGSFAGIGKITAGVGGDYMIKPVKVLL